jgi:Kef-type K+ transport system membrane component KefB
MHSSAYQTKSLRLTELLQPIVMIAAARVGSSIMRHLRQTDVVSESAAGLHLGPSPFGSSSASRAVFPRPLKRPAGLPV